MEPPRIVVDPRYWVEVEVPAFADDERAIRRSRRASRGQLTVLRLGPWFDGPLVGLRDVDLSAVLSDDVVSQLLSWQRHWEEHWVFDSGWRTAAARRDSLGVGEELFSTLVETLWDDFEIVPDFRAR